MSVSSQSSKCCAWLLALSGLPMALPAMAQGTIYRCHALSGALQFQDKPCNNPGSATREQQANREGEVVATAVPPSSSAQEGTPAIERYTRYLDQVSRDRREQQAADTAEAARLQAQAAADRAEAGYNTPAGTAGCTLFGSNGECVASPYAYDQPYAFYAPPPRRPIYRGPVLPTAPSAPSALTGYTPRPLGPNQPPRGLSPDDRSDVLSLSPGR